MNPLSWRDIKNTGGVNMTLLGFSLPQKVSGADGVILPPGFLFPVKEQVASLSYMKMGFRPSFLLS